jgi:lipopolysaccharide export system protein LptA
MKSSLTRVLRVSIGLALLAVVLVIIWYFFSHRRMPSVIAPKIDEITPEKVERQEGIEHFEYRGTRTIQVKAARHFAGDDNSNHLEGNVEIRQTGKDGREEILLFGQRVSYDKDWKDASIEGQARLKYGRLTVESDFFSYQDSTGILATDRGVRFFSPRLAGKAARMTYSFQDDFLNLEGQVEIRLADESESPLPFIVAGEEITYSRPQKTGDARGNVTFSWDQSSGRCEALRFTLTEDEQYAGQVFLTGDVKVDLIAESAPAPEKRLLLAAAKTREIKADEVSLRAFLNMHKIHLVEARGRCFLKSAPDEGGLLQAQSEEMIFVFDRWGGLREFRAVGRASLTERGRDSELARLISGKEIFVEGQGERLLVKAAEGGEARIDSPDSEVVAGEITLIPRSERLEATRDVKAVLKVGVKEPGQTGFFSGGQPVYITAKRMRSDPADKRLIIREHARMWQGNQILSADELTVWRGSGEITGQGDVRASLTYVPRKEEKKEERIEVGGKRMGYDSEKRVLSFNEDAWLKTQKVGLNSDAVTVHLREEKGEIEKIEARGRVIITEGNRQGNGGEALYDLDKETIVLTGNPSLIDKEKGTVEGDKLTFHLRDGRILVENKDRERPVTIIKS